MNALTAPNHDISIETNREQRAGAFSLRILIIDADANLCFIYKRALHRTGYEVYLAAAVHKARVLLDAYHFDLVICDTHLNSGDQGIDLLSEQAAELIENGTQIIMMSYDAQYQTICEAMGATIFVEKPLAIDRLVALVEHLINR
jgi:DNA-binding NtrC family response regulator